MLLSTQSRSESPVGPEKPNAMEEYLHILSGQEKEPDVIAVDHNYSKLWHSHSDSHHAKPAHMLFMKGLFSRAEANVDSDAIIDVETIEPTSTPPYDDEKTRMLSNECDQFLTTSLPSNGDEEKESLSKAGWSTSQKTLYKHVIKILNGNRLSRLSYSSTPSELVKRRTMIDKGAGKMRQLFASNSWEMKLLCWLHRTLIDNLPISLLSEYFEIMKTLKSKMPNLIDKLLTQFGTFHAGVFGACSTEAFNQLIRKPWDPVSHALSQCKQKKLPGNAVIIVVPSAPNQPSAHQSNRVRFWTGQLGSLGKVIQMPLHISQSISVEECLHQLFTTAKNKVVEMRSQTPKRPIILLGWNIGALIACHVALEEHVTAVVCMGFPLKGVSGSRGDLDDPLLDSKIPTLFVVGQNSSTCSMDDIEDFRERMRSETGMVVVGGADDMLRVSVTKKRTEGITQAMVDKCIADEIEDFLMPILNHQYAAPPPAAIAVNKTPQEKPILPGDAKRPRRRPREYSPEISPVKKKTRPVGRPSVHRTAPSTSSSDTSSAEEKDKRGLALRPSKSRSRMLRKMRHMKAFVPPPPTKPTPAVTLPSPTTPVQKKSEGVVESPKNINDKLDSKNMDDKLHTNDVPLPVTPLVSSKLDPSKLLAEQQKNGPVDVQKAFGKDSSFLPRPLTPANFDGTEASSKIAKAHGDMELCNEDIGIDTKTSTQVALLTADGSSVVEVPLSSILGSTDKQKISFLQTSTDSQPLTSFSSHVSSTLSIQKPLVVSKISDSVLDSNKTRIATFQKVQPCDVVSSAGITKTKILSGNSLSVRNMQSIVSSLTSKGLISSTGNPSTSQTVLVSSSNLSNKPTFIVSSNDSTATSPGKIQFRRMLVQAANSPLLSKLTSTATAIDGKTNLPSEQRVCNLSLLSDVAGMKEPIRQVIGEASANATLVKLSTSDPRATGGKRYRLVETIPSSSSSLPPQRLETPEEQAEKQMAIRSLNSSLNQERETADAYSKHDNSLPMMGYSIIMPRPMGSLTIRPPRRPRGRSSFQNIRRPRVRHYFPF